VAAARVRKAGRSVAVIDHRPFGGTCALRGCDPKKMLVSGAEAVDFARRMHGRGVAGELDVDWKELIAFKRSFTDPVPKKREEGFASQGIDAFHGWRASPLPIPSSWRVALLTGITSSLQAARDRYRCSFPAQSTLLRATPSWSSRICRSAL
jgi:hypothetical protein